MPRRRPPPKGREVRTDGHNACLRLSESVFEALACFPRRVPIAFSGPAPESGIRPCQNHVHQWLTRQNQSLRIPLCIFSLKFLPQKSEFPLSNSRNCGSAFCLHFDLADQFERMFLLRVGRIPVNVTADSGNVTGIPENVTEGRCCAF